MVYGKEHSYKLGTMYNLIKWTTERGESVRLSTVTSWLTGPESCCCLHLRKRLVSFVSQQPRSCSLDFHLSIWILTSSQGFLSLKGKALRRIGDEVVSIRDRFEKRAPGRSRPLIAKPYATENKAIRTLFSENNMVELFNWLIGHQIGVIQIAEWSDYGSD